jgi:hypothetical protein
VLASSDKRRKYDFDVMDIKLRNTLEAEIDKKEEKAAGLIKEPTLAECQEAARLFQCFLLERSNRPVRAGSERAPPTSRPV